MSSWHSYPSIYNLGHRAVRDLLNYPCVVEEKVDGSQFSFGLFMPTSQEVDAGADPNSLECRVRSKGAIMLVDAPEKMFNHAVETAKRLCSPEAVQAGVGATPGWTYRCEYLAKPRHNTLAYDRVPANHLIGFDVSCGDMEWLSPEAKRDEFTRLGLETVPTLFMAGPGGITLDMLRALLDGTQSVLGGQLIEGIVVKPLEDVYGIDKKTLMGKFVSERFKEAHKQAWKETSPTSGDILDRLASTYRAEGRWMKAVQHLRDAGQLTDSPKDIGALLIEIKKDTGIECKDEIMRLLWKWAWPHLERRIVAGFPEFYKNELLRQQFETAGFTPEAGAEIGTIIASSPEELPSVTI